MRVLHLYSDWKWTGPAEPVLQMCSALQDRGHDVVLAHGAAPFDERETVGKKARSYGVVTTDALALNRHLPPLRTVRDLYRLPRLVRRHPFDVVHVHLCHDHSIAGTALKVLGGSKVPIVRTLHRRTVLKRNLGYRLQIGRLTDGWLTFTESFRREYIERFGLAPARVAVQPMPIDLERFCPEREFRDMRPVFGVNPDAPLIGIVGRFQKYRKMDLFLRAARRVLDRAPNTRFLIIGHSSQIQDTVVAPAAELGISDQVILAGYRIDDYDDTLAALDVFSLLMPGFDGTARAVREAMALGKPCVVSDFGMLPDIVPHRRAGLVSALDPDALADTWLQLIETPSLRAQLGRGAREHALEHFRIDRVGACLESFYSGVLASGKKNSDGSK